MSGEVTIPSMLIEELRRRGLDPEDVVLNALINVIHLDPNIVVEARLELAVKYLNEGRVLIDKDPVQASEKLYKAAEEAVKVSGLRKLGTRHGHYTCGAFMRRNSTLKM